MDAYTFWQDYFAVLLNYLYRELFVSFCMESPEYTHLFYQFDLCTCIAKLMRTVGHIISKHVEL